MANETIGMSFSTTERKVIDELRGTPTVTKSRTEHFRTHSCAQTPFRDYQGDFNQDGFSTDSDPESGTLGTSTTSGPAAGQYFYEESDNAGEEALLEQSSHLHKTP